MISSGSIPVENDEVISLQNVSVALRSGKWILRDVDLTIRRGDQTVILGPNGSGKSTLVKLLLYQIRPYRFLDREAIVRIFGRDRWDVFELRKLIGIVSPDTDQLFSERGRAHRGLDTVVSGFFASRGLFANQKVTEAHIEASRAALLAMEAGHLSEKPLDEMSTGEVRRVLIARALALDPPALLLDEPTTGLDPLASARLHSTLRRLVRAGKTLILITHHVEEIFPEMNRVVLLRDGQVLEDGPKEKVLTSSALSSVFGGAVTVEAQRDGFYRLRIGRS